MSHTVHFVLIWSARLLALRNSTFVTGTNLFLETQCLAEGCCVTDLGQCNALRPRGGRCGRGRGRCSLEPRTPGCVIAEVKCSRALKSLDILMLFLVNGGWRGRGGVSKAFHMLHLNRCTNLYILFLDICKFLGVFFLVACHMEGQQVPGCTNSQPVWTNGFHYDCTLAVTFIWNEW